MALALGESFFPSPVQQQVIDAPAREILFLGGPGSGKSTALAALAIHSHRRSLIVVPDREVLGYARNLVRLMLLGSDREWMREGTHNFHGKRKGDPIIDVRVFNYDPEVSNYHPLNGCEYDFIGIERGADLSEQQFGYLGAHLRSTDRPQALKMVLNCDLAPDKVPEWMKRRWAEWLPEGDGKQRPYGIVVGGRTVIKASLGDNPYLDTQRRDMLASS